MNQPRLDELARAMLTGGDAGLVERAYLHRAARETALEAVRGRDGLIAHDHALRRRLGLEAITAQQVTGEMVASHGVAAGGVAFKHHLWTWLEAGRIARDVIVVDQPHSEEADAWAAQAVPAPLGELRPGRGQLATSAAADLPDDMPTLARPLATALHRLWNGRQYGIIDSLYAPQARWNDRDGTQKTPAALRQRIDDLIAICPDLVLLFDRAQVEDDRIALLWRLHGHTAAGRRLRLIGSSVHAMHHDRVLAEDWLIDGLALAAQPRQLLSWLRPA